MQPHIRCSSAVSAKVSSNSSGNKHTYAAEAKQEGSFSPEDDILADPDSAVSMSPGIHPAEVSLSKTLNPSRLCHGCNWPCSLICQQQRQGEFPNRDQILHYYYSTLLTSHLQCFIQSHTTESHISVSLEQDVPVCVSMYNSVCVCLCVCVCVCSTTLHRITSIIVSWGVVVPREALYLN